MARGPGRHGGLGLLSRFLGLQVPIFLICAAAGLALLNRHDEKGQIQALTARVGNRAAHVADALTRHDPLGKAGLAQDLLSPLSNDPAVVCVEFRPNPIGPIRAALPPGLGCTGAPPGEEITLPVAELDSPLTLRFSVREVEDAARARFALTLAILLAAFLIAAGSAAIGFWHIVARPLTRLRDSIRQSMETGRRLTATVTGHDELSDIVRAYNAMVERDQERDAALAHAHAELQAAEAAQRNLNETLESRIAARTEELRAETTRANAASEAKTRFLSMMSHEIRTPLNAVLGLAEVLRDSLTDPGQLEIATTIRESGGILMRLLGDILDYSKLDSGGMVFEKAGFSPADVSASAIAMVRTPAEAGGLTLHVTQDPGLPAMVTGDSGRVRQILHNLLSNAVKFTPAGSVSLDVRAMPAGHGKVSIVWTVRDTGIGIPADRLDGIFAGFSPGDQSISRRHDGSGLGLAIARRLAEQMGGGISVASEPGAGSCFEVTLPFDRAVPASGQPPENQEESRFSSIVRTLGRPARILVAEDNPVNQFVMRKLLSGQTMILDMAGDGVEAVEAARGQPYDAIFMDINMPRMDGLEAARAIRAHGGESAGKPIIAVTASVFAEDKQAALDAGMRHFLSKPIDRGTLLSALCMALEDEPSRL